MGITPSANLYTPVNFNYFAIQFGHTDRLRLVAAPVEIINETKSVLASYWQIQDVYESIGFIEFKLKGTPWMASATTDINAKFFLCKLIQQFYSIGWHLKCSSDLQRYGGGSSIVIFERSNPISTYVICLSLNSTDKIRVLAPQDLIPHIRTTIMSFWPFGIQREQLFEKSYEFKLKGNPFASYQNDGIESYFTSSLINGIFSTLYHQGWIFSSAIDSGNRQYDINSLYFRYDPEEPRRVENLNCKFFAVSLNRTDRIRLINANLDLINAFRTIMPQLWPRGVQKEKEKNGAYEFKLKGNPWNSYGEETVESRRLVSNIFNIISQYKWKLYATCILTSSVADKSVFFFRNVDIPPIKTLCISLNEYDKLRLISDNQNYLNILRNCIIQSWPKGIQNESVYYNSYQFKLLGYPWGTDPSSSVYACFMMLIILSGFESQGLKLISSADVSGKFVTDSNGQHNEAKADDLDTWYFMENY